jgi:S1-C subfamily serine protease
LRASAPGSLVSPAMSAIDWVILAFTVLLAFYGYLQGFLVGGLSLLGFALGAFIGTRIGPLILPGGSHSHYAALFGLVGALLAGGVLASGFEGVGMRARAALRLPGLRTVDGLLGAGLTACVGLGIAWIVGAVALQSTNSPSLRAKLEQSTILRHLDELLPPSGPILHALGRFDPLPSLHGTVPNLAPPTQGILSAPGVRAATASVVRILGTACGLGIEGSGWVAAPGIVVTNAHVVAGEQDTEVEVGGNSGLPAQAIDVDPTDDIAILRVSGLDAPALSLAASPQAGTAAAILGYPEDGPLDAEPGRVGPTVEVDTENAYGQGPIRRSVTQLLGLVRPGNSGGPMVSANGQVEATVFAAVTGAPGTGGYAVPNALVRQQLDLAQSRGTPVGTGPCSSS